MLPATGAKYVPRLNFDGLAVDLNNICFFNKNSTPKYWFVLSDGGLLVCL